MMRLPRHELIQSKIILKVLEVSSTFSTIALATALHGMLGCIRR